MCVTRASKKERLGRKRFSLKKEVSCYLAISFDRFLCSCVGTHKKTHRRITRASSIQHVLFSLFSGNNNWTTGHIGKNNNTTPRNQIITIQK